MMMTDSIKPEVAKEASTVDVSEANSAPDIKPSPISNLQVETDPGKSSKSAMEVPMNDEAPASVSFSPTSKDNDERTVTAESSAKDQTSVKTEALQHTSSENVKVEHGNPAENDQVDEEEEEPSTIDARRRLVVEGVGDISLPLSPESAEKLKQVASQAPHGRGMETVVDMSVRNTLQVDADKVTLSNPAWPKALRTLTRKVAIALGVNADLVRPELYKLLLYEPGGFFKKHRDTEKAQGMFATLVIQLPSRFSGGSFIVSHNGKSQTFILDQPDTAPYNCHYVGHYADCEHEILPIESGYRLALIYSLCYTGSEVSKPSLTDLEEGSLASVIKRLDPSDSLFAVPLNHQYTTLSLESLGVGALKGDDRALAQTISRVDGWEMVVATAERTDYESGEGSYYSGFEVYDTDTGRPELTALFHQDGGNAKAHKRWLDCQLKLRSFTEGGGILVDEDTCEEMWGDGDEGEAEYTGNEGATRQTTYTACILVAFASQGVLERLCKTIFSDALTEVQRKPELIDRLLKHIKMSKQGISSENFLKLYQLIQGQDSYWESFDVIFQGLSRSEVPASGVFSIFTTLINELGWDNEKIAPIRLFLEQLLNSVKNADIENILILIEGLLGTKHVLEDKSHVTKLLQATVPHVESAAESSCYSSYSYSRSPSVAEVCESLKSISNRYGWEDVGIFARPVFVKIRKSNSANKSVDTLADEVTALASISTHIPSDDADCLQQSIIEDFVGLVEKPAPSRNYYHESSSRSVWKASKINTVVNEVILHGTPASFQRIEIWASTASLETLTDADSALQKLTSNNIQSKHQQAKDKCIDHIHRRVCELQVADLKKQENELLRKTHGGQPVFSWSMPNAESGDPMLDAFLRGDQKGPSEICVGGGINRARQLAGGGRYGWYGYSVTPNELISKGYSAEISSTNKTGKSASVIVTKTQQLHNAQVNLYNSNIKALAAVQAKLEKLGHRSSQPAQQPAAKRAKPDPEVIVID